MTEFEDYIQELLRRLPTKYINFEPPILRKPGEKRIWRLQSPRVRRIYGLAHWLSEIHSRQCDSHIAKHFKEGTLPSGELPCCIDENARAHTLIHVLEIFHLSMRYECQNYSDILCVRKGWFVIALTEEQAQKEASELLQSSHSEHHFNFYNFPPPNSGERKRGN